jgi:hypothetical protein
MGSGEYIYTPPESTVRSPNLHTLDITELYVQLSHLDELRFDPEPWAHTVYQGHKVTPDAYVKVGRRAYWCEIDRASESPSVIGVKMSRYLTAYHNADDKFPQVIWIAHTTDRVRTLEREARKKNEPGLFLCLQFNEAVDHITNPT